MGFAFLASGLLPAALHEPASWQEFEDVFGFNAYRKRLLAGLKLACYALAEAGCKTVYVNGSFVTRKELPGDTDVCWKDDDVDFDVLDPTFLDFTNMRAAQKSSFGGEFFQQDRDGKSKGIMKLDLERLL